MRCSIPLAQIDSGVPSFSLWQRRYRVTHRLCGNDHQNGVSISKHGDCLRWAGCHPSQTNCPVAARFSRCAVDCSERTFQLRATSATLRPAPRFFGAFARAVTPRRRLRQSRWVDFHARLAPIMPCPAYAAAATSAQILERECACVTSANGQRARGPTSSPSVQAKFKPLRAGPRDHSAVVGA